MRAEEAMKEIEQTWTAVLDPQYSVLGLPHRFGNDGGRYLDVVTGWQGRVGTGPPASVAPATSADVTSSDQRQAGAERRPGENRENSP